MLSKVAERVYWIARYMERVESTARLISIYDNLLFDLPRSVNIDWYNLIVINGLETEFDQRYSVKNERNVIKFLLGDSTNPASVFSSLKSVRENVRTTRDVVPEATWELTNELSMFVEENINQGINRRQRHEFLNHIIKGCQQILGMLYGSMPHDAPWQFLCLGRNLERADMTTRILDAGTTAYIVLSDDDGAINSRQIVLGNVLRSLCADQAYRRIMRSTIKHGPVLEFLLNDTDFPRSITFCHHSLLANSTKLPSSKKVIQKLSDIQEDLKRNAQPYTELNSELSQYLNQLQIYHAEIHRVICDTWFPRWD
ncbi:MAG: alpha-E domain-containing protein [Gammaproteobacteria bacterium]|nr:alpha-E domain-containing protein [Gammaproteobacteria bacterium]